MNYELIILGGLNLLCFYIRIKYGIIFFLFWLFVFVFGFFFTTNGIEISLEDFEESELFYIAKKDDYINIFPYLKQFKEIKKTFHLNNYFKPFGIFYDNPEKIKNKENCRCVIGILINIKDKKNLLENKEKNNLFDWKKFEEFMTKKNNAKNITIPSTKTIMGFYYSFFSVMNSFYFIQKIYINFTNAKFFARFFNPNWKNIQIKQARKNYNKKEGVLEIYDNYLMKFYVSYETERNKFNLYYEKK